MSNDEWKALFVLVTLMVAAFVSGALLKLYRTLARDKALQQPY